MRSAVPTYLVAHSSDRANERLVVARIYFAAKIVDVHIHHVGHRIEIELPYLLDNGGACDRLAFVTHQELEQSKFLRAQIDGMAAALNGVCHAVDFQVTDLQYHAAWPAPPAQNRANARSKLRERERLCKRVVCSRIE